VLFVATLVEVLVEVGGADDEVLVRTDDREVELEVIDVVELDELTGGAEEDDDDDDEDELVVVVEVDFVVASKTPAAAMMMITTTMTAITTVDTALLSSNFIESLLPACRS
jgi:hypothetical protein